LNSVATVLYDMQPLNESNGHGALSGSGLAPMLSYNAPPAGTGFVEAWGQVYADTTNTYPANVRVAVKNVETYIWSLSQAKWVRVQAVSSPGGALYTYNFASHVAGDKRTEPDGSVSVTPQDNYLFHFFPTSHAAINPSDVGGVFTTFAAHLILDNPAGPDNINQARFVADSGADYYPTGGNYAYKNNVNVGVGAGRLVYLTRNWKAISFYTGGPSTVLATGNTPSAAWTESQLQANPPPMDGMGQP
jgi:hypothetical protein